MRAGRLTSERYAHDTDKFQSKGPLRGMKRSLFLETPNSPLLEYMHAARTTAKTTTTSSIIPDFAERASSPVLQTDTRDARQPFACDCTEANAALSPAQDLNFKLSST